MKRRFIMQTSKKLVVCAVVLFFFAFTFQGYVQAKSSVKGIVLGSVYSADGTTPIPGAVIKITNSQTGSVYESTLSSMNGDFKIVGLESGIYRYTVSTSEGDFVADDVFGLKLTESDSAKIAINVTPFSNKVDVAISGLPAPKTIEGETFVGRIVDFNSQTRTADVFIMQGILKQSDKIHAVGDQTDFYQKLNKIHVANYDTTVANPGDTASISLNRSAQVGDAVYLTNSGRGLLPLLLVPAGVATITAGSAAVAYKLGTQANNDLCPSSAFGTNQSGKLKKTIR